MADKTKLDDAIANAIAESEENQDTRDETKENEMIEEMEAIEKSLSANIAQLHITQWTFNLMLEESSKQYKDARAERKKADGPTKLEPVDSMEVEKMCIEVLDHIQKREGDDYEAYTLKGIGAVINWLNVQLKWDPAMTMTTFIACAHTWYVLYVWFMTGRLNHIIDRHPAMVDTIAMFQSMATINAMVFKNVDHRTFVIACLSAMKKPKGLHQYYDMIHPRINKAIKKCSDRIVEHMKANLEMQKKLWKKGQ